MRRKTKRLIYFSLSSLLWGALLFTASMLLMNWNEMTSSIKGRYVTITSHGDTIMHKIGPSGIDDIETLLIQYRRLLPLLR